MNPVIDALRKIAKTNQRKPALQAIARLTLAKTQTTLRPTALDDAELRQRNEQAEMAQDYKRRALGAVENDIREGLRAELNLTPATAVAAIKANGGVDAAAKVLARKTKSGVTVWRHVRRILDDLSKKSISARLVKAIDYQEQYSRLYKLSTDVCFLRDEPEHLPQAIDELAAFIGYQGD